MKLRMQETIALHTLSDKSNIFLENKAEQSEIRTRHVLKANGDSTQYRPTSSRAFYLTMKIVLLPIKA